MKCLDDEFLWRLEEEPSPSPPKNASLQLATAGAGVELFPPHSFREIAAANRNSHLNDHHPFREEDSALLSGMGEELFVVVPLAEDVHGTHHVPTFLSEGVYDRLTDVVIREERKASHYGPDRRLRYSTRSRSIWPSTSAPSAKSASIS